MVSFCFRACSSEASLEGGGDQRRMCLHSPSPSPADTLPGQGQAMASSCRARSGPRLLLLLRSPGRPTRRPWPRPQGPELGGRSRRLEHVWSRLRGPGPPRCAGRRCPSVYSAHPAAAAPAGRWGGARAGSGAGLAKGLSLRGVEAGWGQVGTGARVGGRCWGRRGTGQRQDRAWREGLLGWGWGRGRG